MKYYLIAVILMISNVVFAETDRQNVREGNRQYRQQKYDEAEVDYRKAVDQNKANPQALYNLGCALLAQQKDSAAIEQFQEAAKFETNKMRKSKIYHNIGWICQSKKLFDDAIEAYKESLRNNPADDETRYNLALCQYQKKKEDQQKNDKDKSQDQQQQQDEQKQDKSQDQDQKDDPDQQKPVSEDMDKQNAEQLLNAAMQKEKETQDKLKKAMAQTEQRRLENNW